MARINLLPWREAERHRRRRDYTIAAAAALLLTLAIAAAVRFQIEAWIGDQRARNQYLEEQVGQLDRQIKEIRALEETKTNLLARMDIIQQLQRSRPEVVRLFDELALGD